MYTVDEKDRVVELEGIPQSSIGAPLPIVLANEGCVVLAYCLEQLNSPNKTPTGASDHESGEPLALIRFGAVRAHLFGPPNDEAFRGHPLASRGLTPYGAFRVEHSSWIRALERMNSVHPYHRPERFRELHHFVFSFHDSVFECICRRFDVTTIFGELINTVPVMTQLLASIR